MRANVAGVSVSGVTRVESLPGRARRLDQNKLDLGAAGILAAISAAVLGGSAHPIPAVLFGFVGAASVAIRRRWPIASVLAIATASSLIALTDHGVGETTQGVAAALCFYSLGGGARSGVLPDVVLIGLSLAVVALTPNPTGVAALVGWLIFILLPYVAGRTVESRRRLTHELEVGAERARGEQEARARTAAAEERTRIARELHDVIAHGLSVMVIQTVAAREVAPADPVAARAALAAVQLAGREALLEMRRMIGVLRRGDVELAVSTALGLDQLDMLAQRARMSGLPVELSVRGMRRALPEAPDLVAFRIVQEALTNSIKHAGPASASVTVTFGEDRLELEICDTGKGQLPAAGLIASSGHGLVGMRERLALFDGELLAGPRPEGGFRVFARLPVEQVVAACTRRNCTTRYRSHGAILRLRPCG